MDNNFAGSGFIMKRQNTKNAYEGDLLQVCKLSNQTMDEITKTQVGAAKKPIEETGAIDIVPKISS